MNEFNNHKVNSMTEPRIIPHAPAKSKKILSYFTAQSAIELALILHLQAVYFALAVVIARG